MPYKILEHTADVRISVQAESPEGLFSDAVLAMMEVLKPAIPAQKQTVRRKITVEARDLTALLVDFLNEVLFNTQTNKETYDKIIISSLSANKIKAELRGFKAEAFGEDIKAVTYHEAKVKQNQDGKWKTNLVFDI